jgi:hypothetical protein
MGFTLQSFSPPQSRTPFGAVALMLFFDIALFCSEDQKVTMPRSSRALLPAEIRTRAGRSPRRSMLSWVLQRLSRAQPDRRRIGFPTHSLLRFVRPDSKEGCARRSRALPNGRTCGLSRTRGLS